MIALLSLALASPPDITAEPTLAWTTNTFESVTFNAEECATQPTERGTLPAGTPVMASWLHEDTCGQTVVRVRIPFNAEGGRSYITPAQGVTTRAPRRAVQANTGTPGFIRGSTSRLTRALALGPERTEAQFPDGMPVTLVDPDLGTFADASGQVWLAQDNSLKPEPPVHRGGNRRIFDQRQALATGWAGHNAPVITGVPDAQTLTQLSSDAIYLVKVRREDMTAQREFSPDWIDPIGQTIERTCEELPSATSMAPCGRYWLDYRAFGALWFEGSTSLLLVRYTGTDRRSGESLPTLRIIGMDIPSTPILSREW